MSYLDEDFEMENEGKRVLPIKAGTLFTVSTGCYSDYQVHGVFRALKDIDTESLLAAWVDAHPEQKYVFNETKFLADVTREGYLEAVSSGEWHLGDYLSSADMYWSAPE